MNNELHRMITPSSGLPLDDVVLDTDSKYLEGRVPPVGSKIETADGRCFRLCSFEAVHVAGEMVAITTAQATEIAGALTAAAIGAIEVELDCTGIDILGAGSGVMTKDLLVGGYLMLTDDAGEGYSYPINGNSADDSDDKFTIDLAYPLKVAVTTDTDCIVVGSKYRKCSEGAQATKAIGSLCVPTTGASTSVEAFAWVQTQGPAVCLGAGTVGVPIQTAASGAVADSAESGTGAYDQIVGIGLGTTSNGYACVDLDLE